LYQQLASKYNFDLSALFEQEERAAAELAQAKDAQQRAADAVGGGGGATGNASTNEELRRLARLRRMSPRKVCVLHCIVLFYRTSLHTHIAVHSFARSSPLIMSLYTHITIHPHHHTPTSPCTHIIIHIR
jgi:hypothetical protein